MGTGVSKVDIHKQYQIREKLGKGSFAVVKRAIRKVDRMQFAVKEIKKANLKEEEMATVLDEVNIMKDLDHKHIVRLYEMFESNKKVYMVLELLTGGELFDRIVSKGNYSEQQAAAVMRDLCLALKYLHGKGTVHRDLKPENILYSNPRNDAIIKITDFGLAKAGSNQDMATACGTPGYVAPEVLKSQKYGPAVDVWSAGVILYILLCGFPPFYHRDTMELYKQIKKGQYAFPDPFWQNISDEAKDLVKRMLTVNPSARATPDEVLAHPWISNKNSKDIGGGYLERVQLFQAKSRLRKGLKTIIAVNRFVRALKAHEQETGASADN